MGLPYRSLQVLRSNVVCDPKRIVAGRALPFLASSAFSRPGSSPSQASFTRTVSSSQMSSSPQQKPRVDFSETVCVGETKWLRLETLSYADVTGRQRKWDRCVRATRGDREIDGVAVLAVLRNGNANTPCSETANSSENTNTNSVSVSEERVLLVKQFRPPMDAFTLELPAGLIDAGESAAQAALRELKEETGYVGTVVDSDLGTEKGAPLSPGLSNETIALVRVDVDLGDARNREPQQAFDDGEFCEVLTVRKNEMLADLQALVHADPALQIFHGVWMLAWGIEMGKKTL